jgi:cytochrome P450
MAMSEALPRPDHVPSHLEIDFDFYALGAEPDVHEAWRRVQETSPEIFWTPRNGGHWVATRGELVAEIQLDYERFSHRKHFIPFNPELKPSLPLHLDPPQQRPYRQLIAPAFLPKAVNALEASVHEVAVELVGKIAPQGRCEFMDQFARHLPVNVFLNMVELPLEDRDKLLPLVDETLQSGDIARRAKANAAMREYVGGWVDKRTGGDGTDLISHIVNSEIDGRPISREEAISVCGLVLGGGLDTVASLIGFTTNFLARNPEHRKFLREHPEKHRDAIEELVRRFGVPNTARMITRDLTYRGVDFKNGDQIQIPTTFYGLDERINPEPMKVDFERRKTRHVAFGSGPHTCPGAVLARREIAVFLKEWLSVIPDFAIDPERPPVFSTGTVNSVRSLHLVWS